MADSYGKLKRDMVEACEFLRSFTLGRHGFTQRDGVAAISRVGELCERMGGLASAENQKEASGIIASAKKQLLAAKSRLDLLRR